ncbi:MAG: hypothetical protein HY738_22275, partial [Bacteroidia bacterium]|nr:hypothetical protein [Bacteroidia bacterium]
QHFYNEAETLYKASLHIYTDKFGLTHIINSWPFVLISIFLITVLSFTILKRIKIFTWRNLTFLLNHCGLWVIIVAASAGSGDIKKFSMKVFEKEKTNKVYDDSGNIYQLPFYIEVADNIVC